MDRSLARKLILEENPITFMAESAEMASVPTRR
jgi:hypothetical protein